MKSPDRSQLGSAIAWAGVLALSAFLAFWPAGSRVADDAVSTKMAEAISETNSEPASPKNAVPENAKKGGNFDTRKGALLVREKEMQQIMDGRRRAAERLAAAVPGARVDFDEKLGTPKFVASNQRFLSGKGGVGGAVPAARAGDVDNVSHGTVKAFIAEYADLFGHGPEVLDSAEVKRDYATEHNGMRTTVWQQTLDGIRVFESTLQAHVTKAGELVNVASTMLADVEKAGGAERQTVLAKPPVDVRRAIKVAAATVGDVVPEENIVESGVAVGQSKKQTFRAPAVLDVSAEYVWLPMDSATVRLCWEVVFVSKKRGEMFQTLVDATTGEAVVRHALTAYISPASYRVYTSDSPTPMSPGHATQLTTQPPTVARTLVTLDALDTTASPNGWINDGGNETVGNNVDAHLDLNADNVADTPRPQGSPSRVFDPAMNTTQAPSTYRDASVVNLFYWNNRIHDRYYQLGFTEAAGNFQTNNFGRGGNGNDAVQADSQDGSGTNNANFSTPADGSPGRMQMFVFTGPSPQRDSSFDAEIVIHEYTHGLSNRLVGGGVGMSALQSTGMGEGWSDFYGLCLLSEPGDDVNGNYAAGAYASYLLSTTMTSNYYSGIRRYPYTTNIAKNPLTFRDIDPSQASPHTGIPLSPLFSSSNSNPSEVHGQGEVWCATLWEVRANLIVKHGAATGNDLALKLVTDGMKLAPANPNFLQARDAILQAELVYSSGANRNELWAGFAKRGMGAAATSPASSTTTGIVENYDIPDSLAVGPATPWTPGGLVGGPFSPTSNTYTLANSGAASLNWTVSANQPWLLVSLSGGTLAAGTNTTVTASLAATAANLSPGTYAGALTFTNTTSGITQQRAVSFTIEPFTIPIFAEDWETGNIRSMWAISGTSTHRTQLTTANGPRGGTRHLTMDSSVDNTYARNEATLTVDLAGRSHVQLRFWVKMFSDEADGPPTTPFTTGADFDGVAISANGTTWYEVQPLRTLVGAWTRYTVNLDAAIATYGLAYNSTFKIRFNHYDNYTIPTDGFAFDDIEVVETVENRLTLSAPATVPENGAPFNVTLSVVPSPAANLTVNLASSNVLELSIPSSVVIPAGQSAATFAATPVDDAKLDGTRSVTLSATAAAHQSAAASIGVTDSETAVLTLSIPATVAEGASGVTGSVTASAVVEADVVVTLISSATADLQVPPTVTILAGQTSATFPVTVVNDSRIDGTVNVDVVAHVDNWTDGTAVISVTDNETTGFTVSLPATLREGDTGRTGTVTISGTLTSPLVVALSSSDTTALTVPASVTIAAGATSATFALTIVDDAAADGPQPVTVTAVAAGFTDGTATGSVADNDAHHFSVSPVASPQIPNFNISVSVTARDVSDAVISNFNSPISLSAAGSGGAVAITPTTLTGWVNGVWTGNVKVLSAETNVVLTASDAGGHTGTSNAFDVAVGPLYRFVWSTIPATQYRDTPFGVTITAQDIAGNTVIAFTGTVALSAYLPAPSTSILPVAPTTTGSFVNGVWSGNAHVPYAATNLRIRASDGAGRIGDSALLNIVVATPPSTSASVFTEDFESGVFGSWWTITGTNSHRTQITTLNTPRSGTRHMTMDSSVDGTLSRNEATLTVNLAGRTGVVLRYWAVQYNDEYNGPPTSPFTTGADFDGIAISANGTTWYEVQPLSALALSYGQFSVDLDAAIAARGLSYNSTFKIRFNHYDDFGITTDGFGFDDIAITANALPATTSISLPAQVNEGSGAQSGTVTLATAVAVDTVVALSSGAPAKIIVPASVTVLAGQTTASFVFTVGNDPFLDGNKSVYVTALAPGDNPASATVLVIDDDVSTLSLSPATVTVTEGDVPFTMTATLSAPPAAPITFALSASPIAQLTVPATVTFGIGETTKTFTVAIVDDAAIDGTSAVTLSLGAGGWTPGTATVTVLDNENTNLALTVPAVLREGLGVQTGTVTISGTLPSALTVTLASSDTTEIAVPASATIPAGQTSATFPITVIDDTDFDGTQSVTITASAAGFTNGSAVRDVADNDVHHFSFATIGSPQVRNGPIPVVITARDITDGVVTPYPGTVTLTAAGTGGALVVSPPTLTGFANGVKTAFVQINATASDVQITATDAQGRTGTSNPFAIALGDVASFAWDPVPATQTVDTPFAVRIRALDSGGNTAEGFNGAANVSAQVPVTGTTIGTGGNSSYTAFYSYYQDMRSNSLYTAAELGGAGRLTGIAYNFTSIPGTDTFTNLTIRFKHTASSTLTVAGWDNVGWTQVYRGSPVISATGWMTFNFSTPFDYNGTSNLLVDLSFDRAASSYSFNYVQATSTATYGTVYSSSDGVNGDPLTWSTTPYQSPEYVRADIRLARLVELPVRPNISGNFVNGVWDGQVSVPFAATAISLRASAGTLAGTSNGFATVVAPPPPSSGATVLAEDFESGTLNPAYWTVTGTGGFRTINSNLNGPHGGTRHMTMDEATDSGSYARNEATLSLNLAGRTAVQLKFWAIGYSEDSDGPPTSPFPSTGANFDGVAISADGGSNWYEVQPLRSLSSVYTQYTVDLDAAMAARGLTYGSNFKIRFNQYDNFSIATDGIGIDDILITATPVSGGLLTIPAQATEGASGITGTITLPAPKESDTIVALASSAPAKASVPATVLILTGQTTVDFPITLPEDTLFDGSRAVYVTATVPGSLPVAATMTVNDNEPGSIVVTAPATAAEGASGLSGTVSISALFSGAVTVNLMSSDATELTVPTSVVIPLGQTSATFPITIINDTEIDGTQSATITAIAAGFTPATATTQVTDSETRTFTLSGPGGAYEGQTSSGTVYITGTLPAPLVVTLTSSNPAQFSVPATVTIPAGATSASFVGTAVEDTAMDGTATATITASAATFTSATSTASAYDNDVHHFSLNTIAAAQIRGAPFSITVVARDVNNSQIAVFTGTTNLSAAVGATPLTMTPTVTGAFSSGQWTGSVTISTAATGAAITATGTGGITGTSNTFSVGAGPLAALVWGVVPSPQAPAIPFSSTLSAQDAYGNTVTTFNATATVAAGPSQRTVGAGTFVQAQPFDTNASESRSQMIYLAGEIGAAGRLTGLAFDVAGISTVATRFTIRLKHTTLSSYTTYAWETTGWTTVFQGNVTPSNTGLMQLNFTTPFDFNGSSNLMVDCSFDGTTFGTSGSVKSFAVAGRHMQYSSYGGTDPLSWPSTNSYSTNSYLPNLKLRVDRTVSVSPSTVTLTNGFWSGNLTLGATGTNLTLTADTAAGTTGESNFFVSTSAATLAVTPSTTATTSGYRGGPFTPLTHTYTISNSGSGAMAWTVGTATPWISLSPPGGTVAAGGTTTVTATLNAAQLAALPSDVSNAVLTFTNTTTGIGNTTRLIQLTVLAHGNLTVTPGTGGNYSLANTGDAPLNWTLSASENWTVPSVTSGTLNAGANTTINVALSPITTQFAMGHYVSTLTFTNATTGHGNTSLAMPFDVLGEVPQLLPEPAITGGTTNTLNWTVSGSPTTYQVETATTAGFASAGNSGPVSALSHTFTNLAEGPRFYRVRTSDTLSTMRAWAQATATALGTGTKTNVTPDATGITLLSSGPQIAGRMTNASFDAGGTGTIVAIPGWSKAGVASGKRDIGVYTALAALVPLPTDGAQQLTFFTYASTQTAGEFSELVQSVDLTGVQQLRFDHSNAPGTGSTWNAAIRAQVLLDNTVIWSSNAAGTNINQDVDVSAYQGVRILKLRMLVETSGAVPSQLVGFDNIRLFGASGYPTSGSLVSSSIPVSSGGWGTLQFATDTPAGTSVTVDVLNTSNALLAPDVPSGANLAAITALTGQSAIKLRANLATSLPAATPRLRSWIVTSVGGLDPSPTFGAWSNVVSSIQDGTAPVVALSSARYVGAPSYNVAGTATDLAGVQNITVNGNATSSANGFATWNATAISLAEGANVLTVTASDNAVPPNTTTASWTVTLATDTDGDRLPDAWEIANGFDPNDGSSPQMNGDGDGDGINNLLEFALGLDPQRGDGSPCSTTIEVNPADGLRYVVYHYRRRAALQTWAFDIQTGTVPGTWTGFAATEEAAPPTVHADAVGETLHLRILPALGDSGAAFYRLRVTAP